MNLIAYSSSMCLNWMENSNLELLIIAVMGNPHRSTSMAVSVTGDLRYRMLLSRNVKSSARELCMHHKSVSKKMASRNLL